MTAPAVTRHATDPADAAGLSRATVASWVDLADRTGAAPFLRPEWLLPWWSAFGRGRLELVGVNEGSRLAAAVAVARRKHQITSPTNWHTPVFGVLSEADGLTRQLAEELFAPRPRRVVLDLVDAGGPALGLVAAAAEEAGYWVDTAVRQRAPVLVLDGGWDAYEATLTRNFRQNLRRRTRRLQEAGRVELDVRDGTENLDGFLTEGFGIEASGWKGKQGTSIASRPETDRFYRTFAHRAAERGWLRLAFLRVDGRALAFDLCVEHRNVHYVLKSGYDDDARGLSPGTLLRLAMLRRAFAGGFSRYEFLGSDDAWKQKWTSDHRVRVRLRALRRTPSTAVERWARGSDGATAQWLRRTGRHARATQQ